MEEIARRNICRSSFIITVQICAANDSHTGEYALMWEEGGIVVDGTQVELKNADSPEGLAAGDGMYFIITLA